MKTHFRNIGTIEIKESASDCPPKLIFSYWQEGKVEKIILHLERYELATLAEQIKELFERDKREATLRRAMFV